MKTSFQALAFVLWVVHSGAVGQTPVWTQFPNSPAGTIRNDDIYFADLTNGWSARGTDGVYRTTNSGNTWVKVIPNTNPVAHFRSIGFASATRGWAGNLGPGSYDVNVTDTNMLYETFDGGANWNVVPAINDSGMKGFCAIHVLDPQHIYGAGRVRGPAYFAKSEDGGANWWVTNLTASGVMGGLMDVYFKDATNGFIVGMDANPYTNNCSFANYHGSIARTTNGGLTWQVVVSTPVNCSYFWKMSWPTPNVGYASLQQNGSHSTVIYYKTTDGGATWSSNGIPLSSIGAVSFALQGIGFVSETEGWMGGSSSQNAPTNFIHTTNGGATWTPVGYNNTKSINRIRFLNPQLGYMSGQQLHVFRVPLAVTSQPTNRHLIIGSTTTFNVSAQGTPPLSYQWRFNSMNIPGATNDSYTLTNTQLSDAGSYDVVVSDYAGAVTSLPAEYGLAYDDDFDSYATPVVVTSPATTNGYKIFFNAASGAVDFKAIFGFDYSTVTFPTNIPPAPGTLGGTTRGLFLAVNKDATAAAAAVNLYPTASFIAENSSLKFDLWLNGANLGSSTEHALFGINHSGNTTNRISLAPSDGLMFAVDTDGNVGATTATIRDYAVLLGDGANAPTLLLTNNTTFGPTPLLGPQFDNLNPGISALFPSKTIPGWGSSLNGSAGLGWVRVEVRQVGSLITWLLNGTAIAQYTNTTAYTNGCAMIGYNDFFNSIGDTNSFAIFDNIRVEPIIVVMPSLFAPQVIGNYFSFCFATIPYESYTVQSATNLASPVWISVTNYIGTGGTICLDIPLLPASPPARYFRVSRP